MDDKRNLESAMAQAETELKDERYRDFCGRVKQCMVIIADLSSRLESEKKKLGAMTFDG